MNPFRNKPRGGPDESDIDREIAFHVGQLSQDLVDRGMTPSEARRQALVLFGGAEQAKQQIRDVHASALRQAVLANLRSALRYIRRAPSFALAIVLTLAIGIGANGAVFSAVDAILLRPLPFPHASELVQIHQLDRKMQNAETQVAPLRLVDWGRLNHTFQAISGYYTEDATLTSGDVPEKLTLGLVAPQFLKVWGVAPRLGRDFSEAESKFGGPGALLISDRFWRTHLQANSRAVGSLLRLGKTPYTIVGIMPASFLLPNREIDLWTPSPSDAPYAQSRDSTWFTTFGRLKPDVSLRKAQADLAVVQSQLGREHAPSDADLSVRLAPLKADLVGKATGSLWLLYGSVSLLLLIACTNIAGLLLARTAEREHEISIRYSLGASRTAIVSQLLTEVLVLAVAGSLLGLTLAAAAPRVFTHYAKDLPRVDEIAFNWLVVAYSLACAVAATLFCGLLPAVRGSRRPLADSLARAGRAQVSARNAWQWRLVGAQVSLAVALLIGAGLLLWSVQSLGRVDPGFDPQHVLTLRISGAWAETTDMPRLKQRVNATLDGLRSVPGVAAAATSGTLPGNSVAYPTALEVLERPVGSVRKVTADMRFVSMGYFETMHIPVLQGAGCTEDSATSTVVVNRSFARTYFPESPAIGYHLQLLPVTDFSFRGEIRGVVGDAREQGLDIEPQPAIYWCTSASGPDPNYLIRTHGDPSAMAGVLLRKIHQMEPARSVFEVMPLVDHLDDREADNRLRTLLLTLFAAAAALLVALGLYGTVSYLGRTRRREIALRLALGALPHQIIGSMLLQGLWVTLVGASTGLLLGAASSRLLHGMLFGISALDPPTYAGVLALTILIAAAATILPSLRSSRVNPMDVLREE